MASPLATRDNLDQVKAFHAFCLLGGDCARVASLFRCEKSTIESLAHDFNWRANVTLAKVDDVKDLTEEQQLHRVGVYVVAEKAKGIFTTLLDQLQTDPKFLEEMVTKVSPDGLEIKFEAKSLLDLVKGFQTLTEISYRALGDQPEGKGAAQSSEGVSAAASIAVYDALRKRFDSMASVDTNAEVGRALRNVTPR